MIDTEFSRSCDAQVADEVQKTQKKQQEFVTENKR